MNTITDLAPLLVITYGGYQVIGGNLSIGTMVAFVTYMERVYSPLRRLINSSTMLTQSVDVYSPLRRLINSSTMLTQSVASIDRVFEFLNEPYDIVDKPDAKVLGRVEGIVTMENVSFRYEDEEGDVLKNINLDVQKGETIALVGMSG